MNISMTKIFKFYYSIYRKEMKKHLVFWDNLFIEKKYLFSIFLFN